MVDGWADDLPDLLTRHRDELVLGSGIDPDVIRERGYRSILGHTELEQIGFSKVQARRTPGFLLPSWTVEGRQQGASYKPDSPRTDPRGKAIKYEHPKSQPPTIDVHPRVHPALADPGVELWLTEGKKKADAGISHGLNVLALDGVWNWRGTNDYGGKTALPQWEAIALNGRKITICYDSDSRSNLQVQQALDRISWFLSRREAEVWHCRLPSKPDGTKCGLDDFLLEHTVEQLRSYCQPAAAVEREPQFYPDPEGYLVRRSVDRQGNPVEQRIANFVMVIAEDEAFDDGEERERTYLLRLKHVSGRVVDVTITARDYNDTRQAQRLILSAAGPEFIVEQGQFPALLIAAQKLSENRVEHRTYYTHTGWAETERGLRFLTPGLAVGADGPDQDVYLDVRGPGVELYGVAWPAKPESQLAAWDALVAAVGAAKPHVALPLLAQIVSAPVAWWMPIDKPPLLHIVGETGVFKTTYATLLLGLFGSFERERPPLSWTSTVNALERTAFTLKDLPVLIDDFKLAHVTRNSDLVRFIQNYGDRASRSRMRADLSLRRSFLPRGVVFSTGEDVPEGESSVLGRMFILDVERGDIDAGRLSAAQAQAGALRFLGARYLAWLCRNRDAAMQRCRETYATVRDEYAAALTSVHARIPVACAQMALAFDLFSDFLLDEYADFRDTILGWVDGLAAALVGAGSRQGERVRAERPALVFMEWLTSAIATEQVKLNPANSKDARWIGGVSAPVVGWYQHNPDGAVWISAGIAWNLFQRAVRGEGRLFAWTREAVWRQLATEGLVETRTTRSTVLKRIDGTIVRCLQFPLDTFGDLSQMERYASAGGLR